MTTVTVQFMSEALWREVTYTALLPDVAAVGPGPYLVLLQLHGGNQSHTSWLRYSRPAQYAAELPMIVVLPDGAQSRWANGRTPFERTRTSWWTSCRATFGKPSTPPTDRGQSVATRWAASAPYGWD